MKFAAISLLASELDSPDGKERSMLIVVQCLADYFLVFFFQENNLR
jgi:hypothetical protein